MCVGVGGVTMAIDLVRVVSFSGKVTSLVLFPHSVDVWAQALFEM